MPIDPIMVGIGVLIIVFSIAGMALCFIIAKTRKILHDGVVKFDHYKNRPR